MASLKLTKSSLALLVAWMLFPSITLLAHQNDYCGPALDAAAGGVNRAGETGLDMRLLVQTILGEMDPDKKVATAWEAKAIYTDWTRKAGSYVSGLKGATKPRADVYEGFCREIERRAREISENSKIDAPWSYRRNRLTDGTEIFVGSKGYFFEIKPNGLNFGGRFEKLEGQPEFTSSEWVPPYSANGAPLEGKFIERHYYDSNTAIRLFFPTN